jgi:hypothetical protein
LIRAERDGDSGNQATRAALQNRKAARAHGQALPPFLFMVWSSAFRRFSEQRDEPPAGGTPNKQQIAADETLRVGVTTPASSKGDD